MKNFLTITMIVTSSFIPFVAFAQINLVRDLFVGISGSDVLDLQKILNKDRETQIAQSGIGSFGNETNYFGNLTKEAVQKFQIKYSDYVLKPIGLSVPTGYVGKLTRDFINQNFQIENSTSTKTIDINTNNKNIGGLPIIESITPDTVSGKTKIKIKGQNFTDKNTVIITFESRTEFTNIKSSNNGTLIEFDFESSAQKKFDQKYGKISKKTKQKVLENFPEYRLAISVITDKGQSSPKYVLFKLK